MLTGDTTLLVLSIKIQEMSREMDKMFKGAEHK